MCRALRTRRSPLQGAARAPSRPPTGPVIAALLVMGRGFCVLLRRWRPGVDSRSHWSGSPKEGPTLPVMIARSSPAVISGSTTAGCPTTRRADRGHGNVERTIVGKGPGEMTEHVQPALDVVVHCCPYPRPQRPSRPRDRFWQVGDHNGGDIENEQKSGMQACGGGTRGSTSAPVSSRTSYEEHTSLGTRRSRDRGSHSAPLLNEFPTASPQHANKQVVGRTRPPV